MKFLLGFLQELEAWITGKFIFRSLHGRLIHLVAKKPGIFGQGLKKIEGAHPMQKTKLHHQPGFHQLQHAEKEKRLIPLHRPKDFFPVKDEMLQF